MNRSSKLSLKFSNIGKLNTLKEIIKEYRTITQYAINYIWNIELEEFNVKNDILNVPLYFDYKDFLNYCNLNNLKLNQEIGLNTRFIACILDHARGIVKSNVQKRAQLLYVKTILSSQNKSTDYIDKQIERSKLVKPTVSDKLKMRININCFDVYDKFYKPKPKSRIAKKYKNFKHFDLFVRIKSFNSGPISFPIKYTPNFIKRSSWKLCNSIEISEDEITFCHEIETPKLRTEGSTIGIDTGINSIYTTSEGFTSQKDIHNHSLDTILSKMSRKKKGSKGFKRCCDHRKNHINWSVNQINLDNVKKINLEKINTHQGKKSRYLSHFTHKLIQDKIVQIAEEQGVLVSFRSGTYKSQRCSGCGLVCKGNRKGKVYSCKHCGLALDADHNAAINNSIYLPYIPYEFTLLKLNIEGFFWKEEGFLHFNGQELIVPDTRRS